MIECADKGKGIAGEESSGQEGGASGGRGEEHAQSLDDEIQSRHELLMQERLMHLQQQNQMIDQLRNLTEQFNPPQELHRNLRKNAEKLTRNIQKQNKKLAKLRNEREKILKKKGNAILDQGRESYLDKIELSKEMHKIAKENNKDWK